MNSVLFRFDPLTSLWASFRLTVACTMIAFTPGAAAAVFALQAGQDLIGGIFTERTRHEDTLSDVARRRDLGYDEIVAANPEVDPWLPGEGTRVLVPSFFVLPPGPRKGIVINLPELRLYYYPKGGKKVITYPLGIGREGWETPVGETRITRKKENPAWIPPESIRLEHEEQGDPLPKIVEPGPDNPLGSHALYLGMPGYLIHGTNKPYGVGMRVSHGCIRLYPEDIAEFFPDVPAGTPVRIIDQPYKAGWFDGRLFIEAHAPLTDDQDEAHNRLTPLLKVAIGALGERNDELDWDALKKAVREHSGAPVPVTAAVVTERQSDQPSAEEPLVEIVW